MKMKPTFLKTSIELFGLINGFKLWFEWNIKWPIQKFVWLNITHRPYCIQHGFHCESFTKECNYPKLTKKEDILDHWKKDEEESKKKIIQGKNGECAYCGIFPGRKLIPDPNGSLVRWNVCITCNKIIKAQQRLSMAIMMLEISDEKSKEYWKSEIKKAEKEIEFLSEESFTPTITFIIKRHRG